MTSCHLAIYMGSVGRVAEATVRRYIEGEKKGRGK